MSDLDEADQLTIREIREHEVAFLTDLGAAQYHYDALMAHDGWWKLIGYDTFADWWTRRVEPTMRSLSVKPTRELAAAVVEKVRQEEADLPPAQRRTQRELADMVGLDRSTLANRDGSRSVQREESPRGDHGPVADVDDKFWICAECGHRWAKAPWKYRCPKCNGAPVKPADETPPPETPPNAGPPQEPVAEQAEKPTPEVNADDHRPCEKCGKPIDIDDIDGYTRCSGCDQDGDHVLRDDGTCSGCTPQPEPKPQISAEEAQMMACVQNGDTVVASLRGQHKNLIAWAEAHGRYVRIDRHSEWGNPFKVVVDGDRDTVIANYRDHYLPHKPSLLAKLPDLRGKVLGCWCAPEPCHGDVLKAMADADPR